MILHSLGQAKQVLRVSSDGQSIAAVPGEELHGVLATQLEIRCGNFVGFPTCLGIRIVDAGEKVLIARASPLH